MRMQDQVAIVTGSGTGMGKAIALAFAREGARVAINYSRSENEAYATLEEVKAVGPGALVVKADVSQVDQVKAMVDRVVAEFGTVDVLVNNAGFTHFIALPDLDGMTEDKWDRIMEVNLKGPFLCSKAVAPIMVKHKSGIIINTTSIAGLRPMGSCMAYCVSKSGLTMLTQCLAVALAPYVRVNAVAPGMILTRWHPLTEEEQEQRAKTIPLGRLGKAEHVAQAVVSLACQSDYITGQTIVVDGGRNM